MDLTLEEERITTFKQALERVSALAHAKLPAELHGNLERATALVMHRHVWMDEDGKRAQVLSSDGVRWYPVNDHCPCMDATRAPQGLCKHKIAVMLYKRASEVLTSAAGRSQSAAAEKTMLPEAPASVNVRLCIGGHEVQVTLRDSDETRVLERLTTLLARYPKAAASKPEANPPTEEKPLCPYHGPAKESTKVPGTWYCTKKMADGSYCKFRYPERKEH